MATKTQIFQFSILAYIVMLGYSCVSKQDNTDTEMVNLAESYINEFHEQGVNIIQLRSNYYICSFEDSSSYLITCDGKVIRNISKNNEIISTDASNDLTLPDSLQHLLKLVLDIYLHEINFVDLEGDIIMMETIDGYYLTNKAPHNKDSNVKMIQDKWVIYSKESF